MWKVSLSTLLFILNSHGTRKQTHTGTGSDTTATTATYRAATSAGEIAGDAACPTGREYQD